MSNELHIQSGKDISSQIYEYYRNKILYGEYKPGEKLPSYKSLSEKYVVSYAPIKSAYQALEREGLIRLTFKGSIVNEQTKTVKDNIASTLDEMLQTALNFGAEKNDIAAAIEFIVKKYC